MGMLRHWLRTNYRPGEPIRHLCDPAERNIINNILQDISGVGCRIEKPTDLNGMGWKIVIDGTSDITPPDNYEFPGGGVTLDEISLDWNSGTEAEINDWSTEATTRTESMGAQDGRIVNGGFLVRPAVYDGGDPEYVDGFDQEPEYVTPRVIAFNVGDWTGIDLSSATISLAWSGLTDTVNDPTDPDMEDYMPMVRETSPGSGTYALELTEPATIVSTLFAASGGITTDAYYLLDSGGIKRQVTIVDGLITGIAGYTP